MKNSSRIIILFISLCILFANMRSGVYFAYYSIDKQGFIDLFCENKNEPELHCEGNCKLSEVAEENHKNTDKTLENQAYKITWIVFQTFSYDVTFFSELKRKPFIFYKNTDYLSPDFYIFHPPIFG